MIELILLGLLRGGIFALAAFGFSLVLGILGIVNMSHGVFVVVGALLTFSLVQTAGFNFAAALVLAAAGTGVIGLLTQRIFIARVLRLSPLMVLVQTFALAVVLSQVAILIWGPQEIMLRTELAKLPPVNVLDYTVPSYDLLVSAVALVAGGLLYALLHRTDAGRAIRACADNREMASMMGVNVPRMYEFTMFLCGAWSGLAGGLVVTSEPVAAYMHLRWTIDAFVVIILGGLGSMPGVLLGGFVYGVLNFASYFYLPSLAPAVIFAVLILILFVRPQGLLGTAAAKRK